MKRKEGSLHTELLTFLSISRVPKCLAFCWNAIFQIFSLYLLFCNYGNMHYPDIIHSSHLASSVTLYHTYRTNYFLLFYELDYIRDILRYTPLVHETKNGSMEIRVRSCLITIMVLVILPEDALLHISNLFSPLYN